MMVIRPSLAKGVLTAALLISFLCISCKTPEGKETDHLTHVSVRLQWIPQAQFAGIYVAQANGYYRRRGLDVSIFPGGADLNAIKLVAAGSNDFGVWTADQLLLARSHAIPVTGLAAIFQKSLACFLALKKSGIKSPKDFPGHKVGIAYGYDNETLYITLLRKFNIDRSTIQESPVQYDIARFWRGDIDVWPSYRINQPITASELHIPINIIDPADYGIQSYSDILFTSDQMIAERPEVVRAFVQATMEGWAWAIDHPDETTSVVLRQDPHLQSAHEREMLVIETPLVRPDPSIPIGSMKREVWQSIYSMLRDQGALQTTVDLTNVYTTRFLDQRK